MTAFEVVAAADDKLGIGKSNALPWRLPGDMKFFQKLTTGPGGGVNAVIMGRKTWESVPSAYQPLPGRQNIVLTRNSALELPEGVWRASSLDEALGRWDAAGGGGVAYVIGGGEIYRQAMSHPRCGIVHLTRVEGDFECDAFFPDPDERFILSASSEAHIENGTRYRFLRYEPRSSP